MIGDNAGGAITACYAAANVLGKDLVGGLIGLNSRSVTNCYAIGGVDGNDTVGGLIGYNGYGTVVDSYAAGAVTGVSATGGLIGVCRDNCVVASHWDVESSGQAESAGGTGLTTTEMMRGATFFEAGWDFMGEVENGTAEIWWMDEGQDYPRLWWELPEDN